MPRLPQVSIVVPTYNHASFLRRALDSVINQTFGDWEAIIVNNFSEDETIEIVESYGDQRLRLINFRNDGVIARSRNLGIEQANADLIAFMDSDDVWRVDKLKRCLQKFSDGFDLVCHGEAWIHDGNHRKDVVYGTRFSQGYRSLLLEGNCLSTSAVMVRKVCAEAVELFSDRTEFVSVEDYDFWLRLARYGCRFAFINEILGEAHTHRANYSRHYVRAMRAELAVLDTHFADFRGESYFDPMRILRRRFQVYSSCGLRILKSKLNG